MEKLNRKGITILELLVSIALISIVTLFIYRLLADVTFEKNNDFFASLNQLQRIQIIDGMQSAVRENISQISSIVKENDNIIAKNSSGNRIVTLTKSNDKNLILYKQNEIVNRWTMQGASMGTIKCSSDSTLKIIKCEIPIYTESNENRLLDNGNINNNNKLDDLIFSFSLVNGLNESINLTN